LRSVARYKGEFRDLIQQGDNSLVHSTLTFVEANVPCTSSFGIKYVDKGCEQYIVRNKKFIVKEGQFVLINKGQEYGCEFRQKTTVHGYCFGLDETTLRGVYNDLHRTEEDLIADPSRYTSYLEGFHEAVYGVDDSLSKYLSRLVIAYKANGRFAEDVFGFYYELAAELLRSQKITHAQIQKIKAAKSNTKKELYDRLCKAKEMMDADVSRNISIADLSREAALSEFHFYRSFKSVYGISPHQYLLKKRMEFSMQLVKQGNLPVTEIAYRVGFNDIYAFSKAFKQHFKIAPSFLKKIG